MKCFNKNVLIGLGVVAVAVLLLEPAWLVGALPLLLLAACPLSMVVMMRAMNGKHNGATAPLSGTGDQLGAATPADADRQITALETELRTLREARATHGSFRDARSGRSDS